MRNAAMATSPGARGNWQLGNGGARSRGLLSNPPPSARDSPSLPGTRPTEHLDGDPPSKGSITLAQGSAMLS